MNVNLTQSELNELVYALGFAKLEARMLRKDVADKLESKLFRALAVENVRIEEQCNEDAIVHDMNFKRRYIETGNY